MCALLGATIVTGDVRAKASLISFQQDTDCTPINIPEGLPSLRIQGMNATAAQITAAHRQDEKLMP